MSTPTLASGTPARADAGSAGIRLTLPLRAGDHVSAVTLEPGHFERLYRMTACIAIREGLLDPAEPVFARLVPGQVRDHHGETACLESCRVELEDAGGRLVTRVDFPRETFAAFAAARGMHLVLEAGGSLADSPIAYSLHTAGEGIGALPIELPAFPELSTTALTAKAVKHGTPADDWVVTFVAPDVEEGFAEIERLSRERKVEVAGKIRTRVGFDPDRRVFVRVLHGMVISSQATEATALAVVSTGASWGDFLARDQTGEPQAYASVHSHLHLTDDAAGDGARGEHLLAAEGERPASATAVVTQATVRTDDTSLAPTSEPCISVQDLVTQYVSFPDALSTAAIVTVYPQGRTTTLYGYTLGARLRQEPGYWALSETAIP